MSQSADVPALQERFVIHHWDDPVVESLGFPVHSVYTETVLLPILGPSATWCLRRLAAWAEANPDGLEVDTRELAKDLGLGTHLGRNSTINRTLTRLCQFEMANWDADNWLAVRTSVAPVPEHQLRRLSPPVVHVHKTLVEESTMARLRATGMLGTNQPTAHPEAVRSNGIGVGL